MDPQGNSTSGLGIEKNQANSNIINELTIHSNSKYPNNLKEIPNHPLCLYAKGNVELLSSDKIFSIVGSRRISAFYENATKELAEKVSGSGIVVVTGSAKGGDTAVIDGAIKSGNIICFNNEGKLILFNPANTVLNEKIVGLDKNMNNPFIALDEWLEEEELDIDAVIEALSSLGKLSQNVEKLVQKIDSIEAELKQLQYGKQGLISGLFKSKEARMAELEKSKTQAHEDLESLSLVNKMAHFNMENFFTNFQNEKAKSYYKALKIYALMQRDNIAYNDQLWGEIKKSLSKLQQ